MGYLLNKHRIDKVAKAAQQREIKEEKTEEMKAADLKQWQREALNRLQQQSPRHILFIIDRRGGRGNTFFATYMYLLHQANVLCNGRSRDIKNLIETLDEYVIFDLVRNNQDHINYEVIDQIKNGYIINTKYQCNKFLLKNKIKVACMMNQMPDMKALSRDRYDILDLDIIEK